MDRRYITKLDTVENMKKDTSCLNFDLEGIKPWDYQGEDFAFLAYVPSLYSGVAFSSTKISYMEEVFGLTDLYNGMLIYIMDLDNPCEIEYAKYVKQFYDDAIKIYGMVSTSDDDLIVKHVNKIIDYINSQCKTNKELVELYESFR